MAMLSIIALYNHDPDIFRGFRVPGVNDITADAAKDVRWIPDRQTAIDFILMECGELSLVYTDPTYMRHAIRTWTARRFPVWCDLYNTTLYKYNPIWNKDGTITEERDLLENEDETSSGTESTGRTIVDDENTTGSEITDRTITDDENTSGSEITDRTITDDEDTTGSVDSTGSTDADIKGNVTAFDTDAYSPNEQRVEDIDTSSHADHAGTRDLTRDEDATVTTSGERDLTRNEDATVTTSGERDLTRTETGSATSSGSRDRDRTEKEKTVRIEQGNIGVTTTQAMINEQREVSLFSLYDVIMQDFKHEFCVMVY